MPCWKTRRRRSTAVRRRRCATLTTRCPYATPAMSLRRWNPCAAAPTNSSAPTLSPPIASRRWWPACWGSPTGGRKASSLMSASTSTRLCSAPPTKLTTCCGGWKAALYRPALPGRPRGGWSMSCPRAAIFTRWTRAPCPRPPPGMSARPSATPCCRSTGTRKAPTRKWSAWWSGALRRCGRTATTLPRSCTCWASNPCGRRKAGGWPTWRLFRWRSWAARALMSRCVSAAFSGTLSPT